MGGTVLINNALGNAVNGQNNNIANPLPNVNPGQGGAIPANQGQAGDAFVRRPINPVNRNRERGFNPIRFTTGIVKGFVKEFISIALFIPKLLYGLVTNPIGTIKGIVSGVAAIGSLLANPAKLMELLKKGWECFKEADSEKKGEIIGRILCNFVPVPGIGSPLLLNARLISTVRRFGVSAKAIGSNTKTLARFYRMSGKSKLKTFFVARRIAKKANIKKDFERALKLEGIPKELAPKLAIVKLPPLYGGAYISSKHMIIINKTHCNFLPSWYIGGFIRHEVKHAGQALSLAKCSGRKFPPISPHIKKQIIERARKELKCSNLNNSSEKIIKYKQLLKKEIEYFKKLEKDFYFLPKPVWQAVTKHPKLKVTTKIPPSEIYRGFSTANKLGAKALSNPVERILKLGKGTLERTKFQNLYDKAMKRKYGKALDLAYLYSRIFLISLIRTYKAVLKNLRKYKTCAIEAEAFRAQARYTGLCPRFYSPSIHNAPRLVDAIESIEEIPPEIIQNQAENNNGNQLNEAA